MPYMFRNRRCIFSRRLHFLKVKLRIHIFRISIQNLSQKSLTNNGNYIIIAYSKKGNKCIYLPAKPNSIRHKIKGRVQQIFSIDIWCALKAGARIVWDPYLVSREILEIRLNEYFRWFWLRFCFNTVGARRSIDFINPENRPGSGALGLTEDIWHQKYENKKEDLIF